MERDDGYCTPWKELIPQIKRRQITDKIKKWLKYGLSGGNPPEFNQNEFEWILEELE